MLCAAPTTLLAASSVEAQVKLPVNSNVELFRWDATQQDLKLFPVSSHVCYLTGTSGELNGRAAVDVHRSSVDLQTYAQILEDAMIAGGTRVDDDSAVWKLGGWSFQDGAEDVAGTAACVPMSNFITDPGGVTELSHHGWAQVNVPIGVDCDTRTNTVDMWPGRAASFLAGFRGGFDGLRSRVALGVAASPDSPTILHVENDTCFTEAFEGHAYSFFAGVPGAPRYPNRWRIGPEYNPFRKVIHVGPHSVDIQALAPTDQTICYLTDIGGAFYGDGEAIAIRPAFQDGVEMWVLEGRTGGGEVLAEAECLLFNQRTLVDGGSPD